VIKYINKYRSKTNGVIERGKEKLSNVNSFLVELGLKGKLLQDMQSVIKTDSDLEDFKNFIIINEGKYKSNLQLVYLYTMHLQQDSASREQFVNVYKEGSKQEALESVVKQKVNTVLLNKVEEILKNGLTLETLYDKLVEYKMYNLFQAIKLIALHNDGILKV
jgi:hypothetical protein